MRNKIIDSQPYKVIGRVSAKETLEALIPAIMEIESGYYENVCEFIDAANKGLEQGELGSPYRFESTSKTVGGIEGKSWDAGPAEYVDNITVIES